MSPRPVVLAALTALAAIAGRPGAAAAGTMCDAVHGLLPYAVVAGKAVTTRAGQSAYGGYKQGVEIHGDVCTTKATLQLADVYSLNEPTADVVALAAVGSAVRLAKSPPQTFGQLAISGDLVTGGGRVVNLAPDIVFGTVDTSGLNPKLSPCRDALVALHTASNTLAALPATQTLGTVLVKADQTYTIDARGGAVVQIDALTLTGRRRDSYGSCSEIGATLVVQGNPGDEIVLNVGRAAIDDCTEIDADQPFVLNVPGRGPRVRIGAAGAMGGGAPAILAPDRTLFVQGTLDDTVTQIAPLWVKNATILGLTFVELAPGLCP